jgi:hypothetical protein
MKPETTVTPDDTVYATGTIVWPWEPGSYVTIRLEQRKADS